MEEKAEIGIIGGSGIYDASFFKNSKEITMHTPYGAPSDSITIGEYKGKNIAFIPRHGKGHKIPPHMVNYKANIFALKELGVKKIIGISAVGSLNLALKPGELIVPDQFIDMTKKRDYTFYNGPKVAHISMADPFCKYMNNIIINEAKELGIKIHNGGTYLCIEGPRFSTRAESKVFANVFKADIIGMTLVPEINLACESEMCYSMIGMITDYDVFAEIPVSANEVKENMAKNIENTKKLLLNVLEKVDPENDKECSCCHSLDNAFM